MKIFTDLHIHSKYSRATSTNLDLANIAKYGKIKGLNLIGTADFCHPIWLDELKRKLQDAGSGVYTYDGMNFVLSVELSLIYSQGGKGRRIHHIILAPNFETVDQINEFLDKKGRRDYDGRPIFGFNSIELVENLMGISRDIEIIPAHIWTPWFSLFGSNSGFDSIKDCFGDQVKHIHAVETGLSSDPEMNWRVSELDNLSILSFSDSHSYWPWRLGRECCLFDIDMTYKSLIQSIREKDKEKLLMTLEFFPEEGKYHYDGHRNCNIVMDPKEAEGCKNICPKCKKPLTLGVLHRVEQLADMQAGYRPKHSADFKRLVPLSELISAFFGAASPSTKKTWEVYNLLIDRFGNEFNILLNVEKNELIKIVNEKLTEVIIKNRNGELKITPGYDGVYGKILLGDEEKQKSLKSFANKPFSLEKKNP